MKYSKKLNQILAFTGWTRDKLADLIDVANGTLGSWVNGKTSPKGGHAELVDDIYDKIVAPYICELEAKADAVEKEILKQKIQDLPSNNICK
jgi:Helix-turn-helix.